MKKFILPARLLITLFLLIFLIAQIDFQFLKDLLPRLKLTFYLLAVFVFLGRNVVSALRWQVLLTAKGYPITLLRLFRFYLIGNFFGFFLPTAIGGDIARAYYVYRAGVNRRESVGSVILERLLGIGAILMIALIALIPGYQLVENRGVLNFTLIFSGIFISFLMAFFFIKKDFSTFYKVGIISRLLRLIESLHQYRAYPAVIRIAFIYSLIYQFAAIITVYLTFLATGEKLPVIYFLVFLPFIWVVSLLPVSINGLGVREGTFVFLFSSAGMSEDIAIIVAFLYLMIMVIQSGIGGIFFLKGDVQLDDIRQHSAINNNSSLEE